MNRSTEAGFTLVEVLVVLAIIGVTTGAVVLSVGAADRKNGAEVEAQRLANRLRIATDEALLTGTALTLRWDEKGYDFLGYDNSNRDWRAYPDPILGQRHDVPPGLRLSASGESKSVGISPDGGGEVVIQIAGASDGWNVYFDGYNATISANR